MRNAKRRSRHEMKGTRTTSIRVPEWMSTAPLRHHPNLYQVARRPSSCNRRRLRTNWQDRWALFSLWRWRLHELQPAITPVVGPDEWEAWLCYVFRWYWRINAAFALQVEFPTKSRHKVKDFTGSAPDFPWRASCRVLKNRSAGGRPARKLRCWNCEGGCLGGGESATPLHSCNEPSRTRPERDSQATNASAWGCRTPRCTQRCWPLLRPGSGSPRGGPIPFSTSRRSSPSEHCPNTPPAHCPF